MLTKTTTFCRITGGLFLAFGLVRDVFGDIAFQHGFAEGRFNDNQFGHIMAAMQSIILNLGVRTGFVSVDHPLTMFDKRIDAELAILGFFLLVAAAVLDLIAAIRKR